MLKLLLAGYYNSSACYCGKCKSDSCRCAGLSVCSLIAFSSGRSGAGGRSLRGRTAAAVAAALSAGGRSAGGRRGVGAVSALRRAVAALVRIFAESLYGEGYGDSAIRSRHSCRVDGAVAIGVDKSNCKGVNVRLVLNVVAGSSVLSAAHINSDVAYFDNSAVDLGLVIVIVFAGNIGGDGEHVELIGLSALYPLDLILSQVAVVRLSSLIVAEHRPRRVFSGKGLFLVEVEALFVVSLIGVSFFDLTAGCDRYGVSTIILNGGIAALYRAVTICATLYAYLGSREYVGAVGAVKVAEVPSSVGLERDTCVTLSIESRSSSCRCHCTNGHGDRRSSHSGKNFLKFHK